MRADAVRNREKVLAAAETAFAADGLKAQLDDIARRAGVGVGTVCRHFPTKQALVQAVCTRMYQSLLDRARQALESPDPAVAFEQFIVALPDFHRRQRAFAELMANELATSPELALPVRNQLMQAITELVQRAQAAGAIRSDIGPADVSMLFSGVAHATAVLGDLQPALDGRFVRIVLDGLRPEQASTLPGRPIDFAQLQRLKQRSLQRRAR
ncbi:MAG TPA: TetR/AcrR family transcriptional regulator [Acidimicrobiia bacterium]